MRPESYIKEKEFEIVRLIESSSKFGVRHIEYVVEPETCEELFYVNLDNGYNVIVPIEGVYGIDYDSLLKYLENMEKGITDESKNT